MRSPRELILSSYTDPEHVLCFENPEHVLPFEHADLVLSCEHPEQSRRPKQSHRYNTRMLERTNMLWVIGYQSAPGLRRLRAEAPALITVY